MCLAKVKQILKDRFQSAVTMEVVELQVGKKFIVTERKGATLNINLNMHWAPTQQNKSIRTRITDLSNKCKKLLTWQTANPAGFWPQNRPTQWV